jgi:hypothetical protein
MQVNLNSASTITDSPQANGTADRRRGAGGGGGQWLLTLLGRVVRSEQRRRVCRGLSPPAPGTLAPPRLRGGGGQANVAPQGGGEGGCRGRGVGPR